MGKGGEYVSFIPLHGLKAQAQMDKQSMWLNTAENLKHIQNTRIYNQVIIL